MLRARLSSPALPFNIDRMAAVQESVRDSAPDGASYARTAIELLVDELARADAGLDQRGFYSRLAEVACRIGDMERAVIFRFDELTRRVEAAGAHGIALERLAGIPITLETAPDAARALTEDRVIEGSPSVAYAILPALKELVGERPLVYVPITAAGRWPGIIVAQQALGSPPIDQERRELLWTLGKTLAVASMARIATFQGERAQELEARIDLAREIHDRVVQRLFGVSMALSPPGDLADADRERCGAEVQIALRDLRSAMQRPLRRASTPIATTLAEELARLVSDPVDVAVRVEGAVPEIPVALEPLVQSVLGEAVRNVRKHAHAASLVVRVRRTEGVVTLEVENDGVSETGARGAPGIGLRLAALEALHAGGLLEFGERAPGRWQVRLVVPEGAK
jgi:signal transduction histidine kinase